MLKAELERAVMMSRAILIIAGALSAAAVGAGAAVMLAPTPDAFLPAADARTRGAAARPQTPAPILMALRQYGAKPPTYVVGTDSLVPKPAPAEPPRILDAGTEPPPVIAAAPALEAAGAGEPEADPAGGR